MNILCWNCRGTTSRGFGSLIRDMRKVNDANFIILMETHTNGFRATCIVRKIGLNGSFIQ